MKQVSYYTYPASFFYKHYDEIVNDSRGIPCASWERVANGNIRVKYERNIYFNSRRCSVGHFIAAVSLTVSNALSSLLMRLEKIPPLPDSPPAWENALNELIRRRVERFRRRRHIRTTRRNKKRLRL